MFLCSYHSRLALVAGSDVTLAFVTASKRALKTCCCRFSCVPLVGPTGPPDTETCHSFSFSSSSCLPFCVYLWSYGWMNNQLKRMGKEVVWAKLNVVRDLPRETEENDSNFQADSRSRPRYEPGPSRICRSTSVAHSTATVIVPTSFASLSSPFPSVTICVTAFSRGAWKRVTELPTVL
jgi:hypothetical protein